MMTTVTGKNQITIPAKPAGQLDIRPSTRLNWTLGENGVLVVHHFPSRGVMARQVAGMGRPWLPEGVDPVADLIDERVHEETVQSLEGCDELVHQLHD